MLTTTRHSGTAGTGPLSPQRKWRAIALATLVLTPAIWALLAGLVAIAAHDRVDAPAAAAIVFGLALIPVALIVLALASEHPSASAAVTRAMGLGLLVGIFVSAGAADAVTGLVAGVGAGGIVALRADEAHGWRMRAVGVAVAAGYTFVLARSAGGMVLVVAPIFPFTSLGLADHLSEWRLARAQATPEAAPPVDR